VGTGLVDARHGFKRFGAVRFPGRIGGCAG